MIINISFDVKSSRERIEKCIGQHGFTPEHNFYYFTLFSPKEAELAFFEFQDNSCILASKTKDAWKMLSEPIAPSNERCNILVEFLNDIFGRGAKKVILELREETRENLLAALPQSLRANRPSYIYNWPVYNLKNFDASLGGGEWKKMRNIKNQFEKNHRIEIVDASNVEKNALLGIFKKWSLSRGGLDAVEGDRYINAIENGFKGLEFAKTIMIDGVPCSFSGGWRIPNSKGFYPLFGVTDYDYKYLGEYAAVTEMITLKNSGFEFVDFGGSGASLLKFKMKFRPDNVYKTIEFSIERS